MNTKSFSTRSENRIKNNVKSSNMHIIGLDMGYSAPKCVHENGNFVFPNYCKKISGEIFGELNKADLIYTDENGEKYCVGDMAIASLTEDSVVAEDAMFGRNHYLHPNFKITFQTALGLALWDITTDGSDVFIQTGLPPAYIVKDEPYLRSVIEGHHVFDISQGGITETPKSCCIIKRASSRIRFIPRFGFVSRDSNWLALTKNLSNVPNPPSKTNRFDLAKDGASFTGIPLSSKIIELYVPIG